MKQIDNGVCAPLGFTATGIHVGLRKNPVKKDLALIYSQVPCVAAGVTTQNLTCAAPVMLTKNHLFSGTAQAIICNSGNANACTHNGMEIAESMCQLTADALGISASEVLVGSTGVIGKAMDIAPIAENIPSLIASLSNTGSDDCASAIMTTDTAKKELAVSFLIGDKTVTIGGISKGSGMIHPNMATMLGFITTDVAITHELLQKAVSAATKLSFNMVSVDGDTSTNDMALVLANGMAENHLITVEGEEYQIFYKALLHVFTYLAIAIASDGEGASKLITCNVSGGTSLSQAQILAKGVISSSLVKAAIFGADANWGRILCAMGYSGVAFEPTAVTAEFSSTAGTIVVCEHGMGVDFDEDLGVKILSQPEVIINITVGDGGFSATAWGCDLTYEYVKINGEYRS